MTPQIQPTSFQLSINADRQRLKLPAAWMPRIARASQLPELTTSTGTKIRICFLLYTRSALDLVANSPLASGDTRSAN